MSILHVRHIRAAIEAGFRGRIDLADVSQHGSGELEKMFLSRGLAAYALTLATGATPDVAAAHVVDGSGDNGIDAVYFEDTEKTLYIVQSKWMADGNGSPELGDVLKYLDGCDDLLRGNFEKFNSKMANHRVEIDRALNDAATTITLLLVYSSHSPLSADARKKFEAFLNELNDPTEVVRLRVLSQAELHQGVAGAAEGEPIDLDVALQHWGAVTEPFLSYYGQVGAGEVAHWFAAHGERLFAKNLRKVISHSSINESIAHTLISTPEKFWYYNNGITVLCKSLTKKPIGGSDRTSGVFECHGVSVVNGAQTVGCIGATSILAPELVARARVTVRFISLEGCPESFDVDVTRATNTQNRIENRDFAALDPEQHRLQMELLLDGKHYAFKTGESAPKSEVGCTIDEATVALACARGDVALAVQVKSNIGRLWEKVDRAPYKLIFNPSVSGLRVWRSVQIFREIEAKLQEEAVVRLGRSQHIPIHGNRLVASEVFARLDMSRIDVPSVDISDLKMQARALVPQIVEAIGIEVENQFPRAYLQMLFKNTSRCRALSRGLFSGRAQLPLI